jgi:hypothetical protein
VDNSRLFVDKCLWVWRSRVVVLQVRFCIPPYMDRGSSFFQNMDFGSLWRFLWILCGKVVPNPSTGKADSVKRSPSYIHGMTADVHPHMGVKRVYPHHPQDLLLLRILSIFIHMLIQYLNRTLISSTMTLRTSNP